MFSAQFAVLLFSCLICHYAACPPSLSAMCNMQWLPMPPCGLCAEGWPPLEYRFSSYLQTTQCATLNMKVVLCVFTQTEMIQVVCVLATKIHRVYIETIFNMEFLVKSETYHLVILSIHFYYYVICFYLTIPGTKWKMSPPIWMKCH